MHAFSAASLPPSASRYTIFGQFGAGGMATVQYAEFEGPAGFKRPVAIKRLHPHLAGDPGFATMFLDEARLSARINHANVVATLDVLSTEEEISVVMEYVHGESLASLLQLERARGKRVPASIASSLLLGVLHGLHAAHETRGEDGERLGIVHRDVSPENVLVGCDGVPRLLDFGIAKARGRARSTPSGELKGKLSYMAPEQFAGRAVDCRADVYGAAVVLWETLVGRTLFRGDSDGRVVHAVLNAEVENPADVALGVSRELGELVLRGLARDPEERFASAREMALALERLGGLASQSEVCDWLERLAGPLLEERAQKLDALRRASRGDAGPQAGTRRVMAHPPTGEDETILQHSRAPSVSGMRLRRSIWPVVALAVLALTAALAWLASYLPPSGTVKPTTSHVPAVPARSGLADVEAAGGRSATAAESPPAATSKSIPDALGVSPASPGPSRAVPSVEASPGESVEGAAAKKARTTVAREAARVRARRARERRNRAQRGARPRAEDTQAQRDPCAQPYVVDAEGIRHWKRECL